jgi:mannosyltransferase
VGPAPTAGQRSWSSSRLTVAAVAALTVAALAIRIPSIGNSLFGDELSSYYIVTGHSLGQVMHILHGHTVDLTPPLYYVITWLIERFGDSVLGLRLVSLLAGVAAVPLTYELGRITVGRRAAVVGAAVMAFSPYLIFYSTEARAYALLMAVLLASAVALLRALETRDRRWWAAYAALSCAAMYTHYIAAFLLLGQLIWAGLTHRDALRALVISNLAAAVGFVPWLPTLIKETRSAGEQVIGIVQPFNFAAVRSDLGHWVFGHPYLTLSAVPGPVAIVLLAAGCAVGVAGVALRVRDGGLRVAPAEPWLPLVLALSMPVGLTVWSAFRPSVWDDRDLIASWPGLALVIGALVGRAPGRLWLRPFAAALVVVAFVIGGLQLLPSDHQRPDYRAAIAFIDHRSSATDPIAELPGPSPGPLSEVDAAVAGDGPWMNERRPILRVGQASRAAVIAAAPYATLPAPSPRTLAATAARLAGGGNLFVVAYGSAPVAAVEHSALFKPHAALGPVFGSGVDGFLLTVEFSHLAPFIAALPRYFDFDRMRTFPGFLPVSVYEFSAIGDLSR